jgi:hypothetical protein
MHPHPSPAFALHRLVPVVLGAFVLLLCGCMQGIAPPGALYHQGLQRDAWQTEESYDQALLSHTEKTRDEIPPAYWAPSIQRLRPLRVYTHRSNLVVVQRQEASGQEHGHYIHLSTSPYTPPRSWLFPHGVDGFRFFPAWHHDTFHYTRSPAH